MRNDGTLVVDLHSPLMGSQPSKRFDREKWVKRVAQLQDWYIVVGAGNAWEGWRTPGGLNSSQGLFENTLGSVFLNVPDGVHAVLTHLDRLRNAKNSVSPNRNQKIAAVWLRTLFPIFVEQPFTIWPYSTVVSQAINAGFIKVLFVCDFDLGKNVPEALSNFGFGFNSFLCALSSAHTLYRTYFYKSTMLLLLEDRLKKYQAAQNNPAISAEKRTLLMNEAKSIVFYFKTHSNELGILSADVISIYNELLNQLTSASTDEENRYAFIANALLDAQHKKINKNALDTMRHSLVAVGALFGGLSMLKNPRLFVFLTPLFYTVAMFVKFFEYCILTQHSDKKTSERPEIILSEKLSLSGNIKEFVKPKNYASFTANISKTTQSLISNDSPSTSITIQPC